MSAEEFTAQEYAIMGQLLNEVVAAGEKANSCYVLKNKCMRKAQAMMNAEQAKAPGANRKANRAAKSKKNAKKTAKK